MALRPKTTVDYKLAGTLSRLYRGETVWHGVRPNHLHLEIQLEMILWPDGRYTM